MHGGRHRDLRPVGVERRVQRLLQRHRVAGDKGKLNVLPVAAGEILDHAPALQPCRAAVFRQHQAIGRLPYWGGDDIAEADRTAALPQQIDRDRAPILGVILRQPGQRVRHVRIGLRIDEAQRRKLLEHGLHQAVLGEQGQPMPGDHAAIIR